MQDLKRRALEDPDEIPQPKRRKIEFINDGEAQLREYISLLTNQIPSIKFTDHELIIKFLDTIPQNSEFFQVMCSEYTVLHPLLSDDSPITDPIILSELGPGVICKIDSQEKICSFFFNEGFGPAFFVENTLFIPSLLANNLRQKANENPKFGSDSSDLIPHLSPIYKMIGAQRTQDANQVFEYLLNSLEDIKNSNLYKGLKDIQSIIGGVFDYSKQERTMEPELDPNQQQINQYIADIMLRINNRLKMDDIANFLDEYLQIDLSENNPNIQQIIPYLNQYFHEVVKGTTIENTTLTISKKWIGLLSQYCCLQYDALSKPFDKMDNISQLMLCILNETKKMPTVELKPNFILSVTVYREDAEDGEHEEDYDGYEQISDCFTEFIPEKLKSKIRFGISLVDAWKQFSKNITAADLSPVMAMVNDDRPLEALITLEHIRQRISDEHIEQVISDITALKTAYLEILKGFPNWTSDQQREARNLAKESNLFFRPISGENAGKNEAEIALENMGREAEISTFSEQLKESIFTLAGHRPDIKSDDNKLIIIFNHIEPEELETFSAIANLTPEHVNTSTVFTVIGNEAISNFFTVFELPQAETDAFFAHQQSCQKIAVSQTITETNNFCLQLEKHIYYDEHGQRASATLNNNHELLIKYPAIITQQHHDYKSIVEFFSKKFKTTWLNDHLTIRCIGHQQICDLFSSLKLIDKQNSIFIGNFYAAHQKTTEKILIKELDDAIKKKEDLTPHHLLPIMAMIHTNKFNEALSILGHLQIRFRENAKCLKLIDPIMADIEKRKPKISQPTPISESASHLMFSPPSSPIIKLETPDSTTKKTLPNNITGPRG